MVSSAVVAAIVTGSAFSTQSLPILGHIFCLSGSIKSLGQFRNHNLCRYFSLMEKGKVKGLKAV